MNIGDFEPTNSGLLSGKILNIHRGENRRIKTTIKPIKNTPTMMVENTSNIDSDAKYPIEDEKKIFGMKPKTIALALGVIVVSILIINMIGVKNSEIAQPAVV